MNQIESPELVQLDALEKRLGLIEERAKAADTEDDRYSKYLIELLHDVCKIARNVDESNASSAEAVIAKAAQLIDRGIYVGYDGADLFEFMPSFAHQSSETLVKDQEEMLVNQGLAAAVIPFAEKLRASLGLGPIPDIPDLGPGPWSPGLQPHPKTTPLSRFRTGVRISIGQNMPLATTIYQARCEITDDSICQPWNMHLSSGGSCIAITSAGGWKNRDPIVTYCVLDSEDPEVIGESRTFDPRLIEPARHVFVDESRKLIFVGDDIRVKSFSWEKKRPQAVHTLWTSDTFGPLALLPQDRFARAGKGEAFVWNINELETHGPTNKHIGEGILDPEGSGSSRDNENGEIELSPGSKPHHIVKFAEKDFSPCTWQLHTPTNRLIASHNSTKDVPSYGCIAIDLEHGGKTAARYLGHAGQVEGFSMSEGDPNVFATAGSDGFARLYDVRHPLPVITFDAGSTQESCADVVLVHPDGAPTLFTGGQASQQIKMWDVRARCCVYELATGNNSVSALAWDSGRSMLYAATECEYMDRLGYNHDYRRAKMPREQYRTEHHVEYEQEDDDDKIDSEDEDEDDDALEGDEKLWPTRAHHNEDHFGCMFDAGDHRLYRYAFKEDANPDITPPYGTASLRAHQSAW